MKQFERPMSPNQEEKIEGTKNCMFPVIFELQNDGSFNLKVRKANNLTNNELAEIINQASLCLMMSNNFTPYDGK